MSWFPNIPNSVYGSKKEKVSLTNESKKARKDNSGGNGKRAHTIQVVKRNRQVLDQQAAIKIKDIQNIMEKHFIFSENEINRIAALCTKDNLFDSAFQARMFIIVFRDKIFS
ncbi:MAG TPA: hypothetical protein VMS35_03420 [Nitrososphaeraceae archaeon]|nr:hypothetical protein [Nitrososphaeraceae archaeon]